MTKMEIAICKNMGANWVSYDESDKATEVTLWRDEPYQRLSDGAFCGGSASRIASFSASMFPTLNHGDLIYVKDEDVNGTE